MLREAALVGGMVDDRLLAAVAGRPMSEIGAALREAVAHQILVLERGGCRFRHALVREALYDELLPGERQRLHVATATALDAQPELAGGPEHVRWALLAYHWAAAGEQPDAFAASVRAGLEAQQVERWPTPPATSSEPCDCGPTSPMRRRALVSTSPLCSSMLRPPSTAPARRCGRSRWPSRRSRSSATMPNAERRASALERLGHHR